MPISAGALAKSWKRFAAAFVLFVGALGLGFVLLFFALLVW
jgi:hypothetical protein